MIEKEIPAATRARERFGMARQTINHASAAYCARPKSYVKRCGSAAQRAGYHDPLDLVGALVDLRDLRVAHHPLERVLLHVAVAAEDLNALDRDVHRGVRGEQLRHRRVAGEVRVA